MSNNPLFPQDAASAQPAADPAVELIRAKVNRALGDEPDAAAELAEVEQLKQPSKHQLYMQELSSQGLSLAEIQTAWHRYYTTLPDEEKHDVWQEFYAANQHTPYQKLFQKQQAIVARKREEEVAMLAAPTGSQVQTASGAVVGTHAIPDKPKRTKVAKPEPKAVSAVKRKITDKVSSNGKLKAKQHFQSLAFGLGTGFVVLLLFLFTFFNEYVIAPFIQPSRTVSATPIIQANTAAATNMPPSVVVPKINIQIPVDFNLQTTDNTAVENSLEDGVIHYPSTVKPGQNGNVSLFGHSSGNIFNNGKYKFAFTLLHNLTNGDLFYVNYSGKTYVYRVFDRQVVPPTAVSIIKDTRGKQATAQLITCDPPGLSTNRLVIWGEQIQPSITTNTNAVPQAATAEPAAIAGNGQSLWSKFVDTLSFWN